MKSNIIDFPNIFKPVHLHLELKHDFLSNDEKIMLRRYGESSTGDSISRDILIPSDMPLHHLHYAIQRLFGWQNSHLRKFVLPEAVYNRLTGATVKVWAKLVGVLFQPPSEGEKDLFWDDDYQRGSIKTWLKKKYTGPYQFLGLTEDYEAAQENVRQLINHFSLVEVKESFEEFRKRAGKNTNKEIRTIRKAPLAELTLQEMNNAIYMESGTDSLLERLVVDKVLAYKDELIDESDVFPTTNELIYKYDFGDDWNVIITKERDCSVLLEKVYISEEELVKAEAEVLEKHSPVCIYRDGVSVIDDIGGLSGFARFLGDIYEGEDKEEQKGYLEWAKGLGWSNKKIPNKMML